ncbi:MAG: hypothetical protein BZY81_08245 [SAR202 cluster bacterium Io17-Chloro-G4]|nr:MAG: hypothetical protein BZY81_08245 [SAR202 cluster bacterium Io17-Chloro-G4]
MADAGYVKVAQLDELSPGEMMMVEMGAERILLANVDGNIHAVEDICSHAYASLSEGDLNGQEVECPLHGAAFDLATGEPITPPATEAVKVYELRVEGQDILLGPAKS